MIKKNKKTLTALLAVMLITSIAIFYAYKKEEADNTATKSGKTEITSINVHAKTACYYKNSLGSWILWLNKVPVSFTGQKFSDCASGTPYNPFFVPDTGVSSIGGITEKYYTFSHPPTYLDYIYANSLTSNHACENGTSFLITIKI